MYSYAKFIEGEIMWRMMIVLGMLCLCLNTAAGLSGSGTEAEPWRIETLADFHEFAADANYWVGYTRLETDVNLAGRTYSTAVIAHGTVFGGFFDGNDHKIINLTIDGGTNDYLGLFGKIKDGEVRNLGLEGGSVRGYSRVGGLVGDNYYGNVSNCYSTGDVSGDYLDVGGLVGISRKGYVSDCYSTGDVSGNHVVGALVGGNSGSVSNCYSTGDVNGGDSVGGLVGDNSGSVSYCYSIGDVNGYWYVGGLMGVNHFDFFYGSGVSNCYSTGDVSGIHDYVGGLLGYNTGNVSNCYSISSVSGDYDVGGLVGYVRYGDVSNCYSTGDVNGVDSVGGLVGKGLNTSKISNCFWDTSTQTHGVTESIGLSDGYVNNVEGIPTIQMQTKSTFTDAGWDFIEIWDIGEKQTYPYLRAYLSADLNHDGRVNMIDFAILAGRWLEGAGG